MKKFALSTAAMLSTCLGTSNALASYGDGNLANWIQHLLAFFTRLFNHPHNPGGSGGGGGNSVPEIDVMVGPVAVAVLAGVIAIGVERRRNKK